MKKSIEGILNSHGVKPTPQRVVIAEFVFNTDSHPTADDIMQAVLKRLPVALSRATVYNTLNTLVEKGVIREVYTEPGAVRYDANLSKHHHFVDSKTSKIYDIPWDAVPQLSGYLSGKYKVNAYQITFFGELAEKT